MSDPIPGYLADLERALPPAPLLKRRILAEAEDHLREAAAVDGAEAAVERFGDATTVARGFAPAYGAFYARLGVVGTLALAAGSFLLLYPIPEALLPPAPWAEKPGHLAWKQDASLVLFFASVAAALGALVAIRRPRIVIGAVAASLAGLTATAALGSVLAFQWADAVPGTPGWLPWLSLAAWPGLAVAGLVVVCASRPVLLFRD